MFNSDQSGSHPSGAERVKLYEGRKSEKQLGAHPQVAFFFLTQKVEKHGSPEMIKTFGNRADSTGLRL